MTSCPLGIRSGFGICGSAVALDVCSLRRLEGRERTAKGAELGTLAVGGGRVEGVDVVRHGDGWAMREWDR